MPDGYEVVKTYDINRKTLEITEVAEPPQVDDELIGWTIEAVYVNGAIRLRSPAGHVKTYTFFRSANEMQLSNRVDELSRKLAEWQQQTGYSCPSSAGNWLRLATEKALKATRDKEAMAQIRPAVLWFAERMEVQLSQNEHKESLPRPTMEECLTALRKHFYALCEHCQIDQENDPLQQKWHAAHMANWLLLLLGKDVNAKPAPSGESAKS